MTKQTTRQLTLKDGTIVPEGTTLHISVPEHRPTVAELTGSGFSFTVRSVALHTMFRGFIKPKIEFDDPDFDGCIVPSLTGEDIEPDGWDSKGFPSILLAKGYL